MAEKNDEVANEEVVEEQKAQPAQQSQTSGFARWVEGLTSSRIVVLCCMFALAFIALQYFFTVIVYVGVLYTIFQVLKLLCMIGAGIAFSFKLIRAKGVTLDGSFVLFIVTIFMGFFFA